MLVNTAHPSRRQARADLSSARNRQLRTEEKEVSWWLWPHVLSLDAPLVAVTWQWWWQRSGHIRLLWCHPLVLGLAVWLIYLADRLIDTSRFASNDAVTARHAFHARWRGPLYKLTILVMAALALLTPFFLPPAEFLDGLLFLPLAVGYFWLVHGRWGRAWSAFLPKELAVGILFALGTAFFPWCQTDVFRPILVAGIALFSVLCFCNCALITSWEGYAQDVPDLHSLLNAFPKLTAQLRHGCFALACLAAGGIILTNSTLFLPLTASSLALAALDRYRDKFSANALRVLADAALLTPLVVGGIWYR